MQDGIRLGQISEAHGKILKGIKDRTKQVGLFKQIVAMGLSVKATESLLREQSGKGPDDARGADRMERVPRTRLGQRRRREDGITSAVFEEESAQKLGVPVEIRVQGKDAGQIVLDFAANDDFNGCSTCYKRPLTFANASCPAVLLRHPGNLKRASWQLAATIAIE